MVTVYNQAGAMQGVLDNADAIGYTLKHNDLHTASFQLPKGDPKNALCAARNLVRLPDGPRELGLYRIVDMPESEEVAQGGMAEYSLEHVMATLLDDPLFGYHEIGGVGVSTADVIRYILARQTTVRWQLGVCEYNDHFSYKFENVKLLSALLSLGEVITGEYTWEWDTTTTPWTVNLRVADSTPGCGIHYGRNMVSIKKRMEAKALVTRLYLLGYGEGVNQLTVKSVNGGLPYIDADTIGTWGMVGDIFTDTRIEDAATLLARGRAVLEGYKNPYFSYEATAADLTRLTGLEWDKAMPGKLVRVLDGEHGLDFSARIVSISKASTKGDPGKIKITIANAVRDAASSINTLADRVGIGELYSQGATNLYAMQYADNGDATHPVKLKVYVPSGCVRINKMLLSWDLEAFRAFETGAAAGGGTATTSGAGGGGTTTSAEEPHHYLTDPAKLSVGSAYTGNPLDPVSMNADLYSDWVYGGAGNTGASSAANTGASSLSQTGSSGAYIDTGVADGYTDYATTDHYHTIDNHNHYVSAVGTYSSMASITTNYAFGNGTNHHHGMAWHVHKIGAHDHSMSHTHNMAHTHSTPDHLHNINHVHWVYMTNVQIPAISFEVPQHSHNVSRDPHTHSVSYDPHTHDITYGIYEGGTATGVTIVVDGTAVPAGAISGSEMDMAAYLAKDADGKITRGAWHLIQIVPNSQTRLVACLFVQMFIQSVGGGDY